MGEVDTIRGVWRGALAIMVRYPFATLAPALVLGAIGEVPAYLIDRRFVLDQAVSLATAYLAYYLYLAYAEGIIDKAKRGTRRLGLRGTQRELIAAVPYVPSVLMAALIALAVTTLATGLLLLPGMWLYTRWSLATPVIRGRGLGPIAATRRSNQLVKGHFVFVFMTATVAYYLEGVVVHAGAQAAGSATGSYTWGEWVGGSAVSMLVVPLAAFATSLAHACVARRG